MNLKTKLFEVIFEPKTLSGFVLPSRIRDEFPEGKVEQNYLFYGEAGTGKSSIARVLGKNYNTFVLDASIDTSVDNLRQNSALYEFCATQSLMSSDQRKLVILDELNGVSKNFFEALKGFMNKFSALGVVFIGTTNYYEDIEPAIKSRMTGINFGLSEDEQEEYYEGVFSRTKAILDKIEIQASDEVIKKLISKSFPDWRGILQDLQHIHRLGEKVIKDSILEKDIYRFKDIYELIARGQSSNPKQIMDLVIKFNSPVSVINSIDKDLLEYISKNYVKMLPLFGDYIITIAKYSDMVSRRIDPSLTLKAMIFELIKKRERFMVAQPR